MLVTRILHADRLKYLRMIRPQAVPGVGAGRRGGRTERPARVLRARNASRFPADLEPNTGNVGGGAAVADPFEPSRSAAHRLAGAGATAFPAHRGLLADPSLDAVVIATPNHTHAAVLKDALATDKAILVEKPLCTTVEDCRRMEETARRRGNLVRVGMEYRYMPPVSRLVEAVHTGAVGRLRMLHVREHRGPFLPKVGHWNRFARNTGGTLVDRQPAKDRPGRSGWRRGP